MEHRTFDVAKWSTADIESIIDGQDIELTEKELPLFVEDVIDNLSVTFDASVGINWDVLEIAVEDVNNDWNRTLEDMENEKI